MDMVNKQITKKMVLGTEPVRHLHIVGNDSSHQHSTTWWTDTKSLTHKKRIDVFYNVRKIYKKSSQSYTVLKVGRKRWKTKKG